MTRRRGGAEKDAEKTPTTAQKSAEGAEGLRDGSGGAKTKPIWGEVDMGSSRVRAALGWTGRSPVLL